MTPSASIPAGQRAVVVARNAILGEPVGMLLLACDATVTLCHSRTTDLASVVNEADVVVAVGRPYLVPSRPRRDIIPSKSLGVAQNGNFLCGKAAPAPTKAC